LGRSSAYVLARALDVQEYAFGPLAAGALDARPKLERVSLIHVGPSTWLMRLCLGLGTQFPGKFWGMAKLGLGC